MNEVETMHRDAVLHLIRSGMLFELQEWIAAGQSLRVAGQENQALLEAADRGFHSMVKVLLDQNCWSAEEIAEAAQAAALRQNYAVLLLLMDQPGVAKLMTPSDLWECASFAV